MIAPFSTQHDFRSGVRQKAHGVRHTSRHPCRSDCFPKRVLIRCAAHSTACITSRDAGARKEASGAHDKLLPRRRDSAMSDSDRGEGETQNNRAQNGGGRRCGAQKPMRTSHIAVAFARPYRPWRDNSRSDLRTARGGAWPWSSTRVQAVQAIARRRAAHTQAGGRRLAARTLVEQARGDLPRLPTPAHRGRRQTGAHVAGAPPPAQRPPGPRPPGPLR